MKKTILRIALLSVVLAITSVGIYKTQKVKPVLSALALENVEALADDEVDIAQGCQLHLTSICVTEHKDHFMYRNRE